MLARARAASSGSRSTSVTCASAMRRATARPTTPTPAPTSSMRVPGPGRWRGRGQQHGVEPGPIAVLRLQDLQRAAQERVVGRGCRCRARSRLAAPVADQPAVEPGFGQDLPGGGGIARPGPAAGVEMRRSSLRSRSCVDPPPGCRCRPRAAVDLGEADQDGIVAAQQFVHRQSWTTAPCGRPWAAASRRIGLDPPSLPAIPRATELKGG